MSKKIAAIVVSIIVGTALLATTAFASMTGATGYDAYKSAVKSFSTVKSMTVAAKAELKDNGSTVLDLNSSMKFNKDTQTMSQTVNVKAEGIDQTSYVYSQDGKMIYKAGNSDVYSVSDTKQPDGNNKHNDGSMSTSEMDKAEKVIDALVGNLQNNFTFKDNGNGTKDVAFELTEGQVPAVINAVLSIAAGESGNINNHSYGKEEPLSIDFKDKLPKLVDNVIVKNVTANAKMDKDNHITNQTVEITVTGNDEKGTPHTVVLTADLSLSGFNGTTPDSVDLTGKNIKNISRGEKN